LEIRALNVQKLVQELGDYADDSEVVFVSSNGQTFLLDEVVDNEDGQATITGDEI